MSRKLAIPGVVLVSIAAGLWGLDALIRKPLVGETAPATIVFGEHVLLVAITLPFLIPALRKLVIAGWRAIVAGVAIGAGASAAATILFTQAFVHGDYITPLVLQKAQPLVAVVAAWFVLGEHPRPRFGWYLIPGLAGIWLISIPDPLNPQAHGLKPVAYALAAAVLWGLGTVLGRYLTRTLSFQHVSTVRFFFGLAGSLIAVWILGVPMWAGAHNAFWIGVLAVVTGAIAIPLYYYGLKRTPAMLAALGELSFIVVATLVGLYVQNPHLNWTQWLGIAITAAVVTLLPMQRRRSLVAVPAPAPA